MSKNFYEGKINIFFPWDLPDKISSPAVMFDVVAASHNIAYLVNRVKELYVVTKVNVREALRLIPDGVLIGESDDEQLRNELQDKFIFNNTASSIAKADVGGKKVILITNNGTHTLSELWDKGARPIILAGYANLQTVVDWLLKETIYEEMITLVPSGGREKIFSANPNLVEDFLCARAAESLMRGIMPNFEEDFIKAKEFIDQYYPKDWPTKEADLALIFTNKNLYPVVPVCLKHENGLLYIKNINR